MSSIDASGNQLGLFGPDSEVSAGLAQLDQFVTVTASPTGGPDTVSAVTGNWVITQGASGGPMAPSARRMLRAIANAAPTVCGGGAFLYGGLQGEKGNLEGAGMGLVEYGAVGQLRGMAVQSAVAGTYNAIAGVGQETIELGITATGTVATPVAQLGTQTLSNVAFGAGIAKFAFDASTVLYGYFVACKD